MPFVHHDATTLNAAHMEGTYLVRVCPLSFPAWDVLFRGKCPLPFENNFIHVLLCNTLCAVMESNRCGV
jgi:hypothetical protein